MGVSRMSCTPLIAADGSDVSKTSRTGILKFGATTTGRFSRSLSPTSIGMRADAIPESTRAFPILPIVPEIIGHNRLDRVQTSMAVLIQGLERLHFNPSERFAITVQNAA